MADGRLHPPQRKEAEETEWRTDEGRKAKFALANSPRIRYICVRKTTTATIRNEEDPDLGTRTARLGSRDRERLGAAENRRQEDQHVQTALGRQGCSPGRYTERQGHRRPEPRGGGMDGREQPGGTRLVGVRPAAETADRGHHRRRRTAAQFQGIPRDRRQCLRLRRRIDPRVQFADGPDGRRSADGHHRT